MANLNIRRVPSPNVPVDSRGIPVKMPSLEKIIQFRKPFLRNLTKVARDNHVRIIMRTSTNPDGKRFPKLTKKYKKFKAQKYNSTKPNLRASGLMLSQLEAQEPRKSSGLSTLNYAIKGNATHEKGKSSGQIMNYHQEGAGHNKVRDIAGERVLHKHTQKELAKRIVNQINKNIEETLAPYEVTLRV